MRGVMLYCIMLCTNTSFVLCSFPPDQITSSIETKQILELKNTLQESAIKVKEQIRMSKDIRRFAC